MKRRTRKIHASPDHKIHIFGASIHVYDKAAWKAFQNQTADLGIIIEQSRIYILPEGETQ